MAAGRRNAQGRNPDIEAKERDLRDREERLAQVCTGDMCCHCVANVLLMCTGDMCCWCCWWCWCFVRQNLEQSCASLGRSIVEDMCYVMRQAGDILKILSLVAFYGMCTRALTFELWRAQRQAAFEKDLLRPMTGIHSEKYTLRCISIVKIPGH
jgi:hypothetical protein